MRSSRLAVAAVLGSTGLLVADRLAFVQPGAPQGPSTSEALPTAVEARVSFRDFASARPQPWLPEASSVEGSWVRQCLAFGAMLGLVAGLMGTPQPVLAAVRTPAEIEAEANALAAKLDVKEKAKPAPAKPKPVEPKPQPRPADKPKPKPVEKGPELKFKSGRDDGNLPYFSKLGKLIKGGTEKKKSQGLQLPFALPSISLPFFSPPKPEPSFFGFSFGKGAGKLSSPDVAGLATGAVASLALPAVVAASIFNGWLAAARNKKA